MTSNWLHASQKLLTTALPFLSQNTVQSSMAAVKLFAQAHATVQHHGTHFLALHPTSN
jgi:hypothetical protein